MPVELLPWLAAAVIAGGGGILALIGGRVGRLASLIATALGLIGALAGLGWRGAAAGAWPGYLAADALVLLAAGALVILFPLRAHVNRGLTEHKREKGWIRGFSRSGGQQQEPAEASSPEQPVVISEPAARKHTFMRRDTATSLALFGVTAMLVAAMLLAWRAPATSPTWGARAPLFGLRSLLTAVGLGGWLVVLAASAPWAVQVVRRRAAHGRPADDPGRLPALITFPWLTAALLAGAAWQLAARAAPWHSAPAALWQIVAWLLGASYLHITSNWQPMRAPAWLATVLSGLAFAAAICAALQAASWLSY